MAALMGCRCHEAIVQALVPTWRRISIQHSLLYAIAKTVQQETAMRSSCKENSIVGGRHDDLGPCIRLDLIFRVALANVGQWWDVFTFVCHGGLGRRAERASSRQASGPSVLPQHSEPATRNHTSYAVSLMGPKLATLHASMMYFSAYIC